MPEATIRDADQGHLLILPSAQRGKNAFNQEV